MSSMLKNLNNIRSLRAMAREFSVDVLEDMLEKFRVVTKERRDEEEQLQRQRAEQQAKINALLAQMQADGISPEELLSIAPATARSVKNANHARRNIVLSISMVKRKHGPDKVAHRNQLPGRWLPVNLLMTFDLITKAVRRPSPLIFSKRRNHLLRYIA